ncbi:outer membrane protein [Paracoccus ravus]|uniref:outer membrane protein n=1 Tax=Paracoccus ravus TaxID=2447760 RepID=UPI001FD6CD18|nr:outer membrane beta-barrel protein [Paracoccus ravus]
MKKITVMATSLTLGASAAAYAGGYTPPVTEPIIAPVIEEPIADWSGGYFGGTLGYAFGGSDEVGISDSTDTLLGNIGEVEVNGANIGLRVGYRWQRDKWTFGPELGYEFADIRDETSADIVVDGDSVNIGADAKVENILALRFKTGYIVRPDTMVYGIAGWARASVDYEIYDTDVSYDADGYIVGLGVERMINDRMSVTGEWEYADFGKETLEAEGLSTRATMDYHNFKIGVNYKF